MIAKLGYGELMLNEGTFTCFILLYLINLVINYLLFSKFDYQLFVFSQCGKISV